MDNNNNNNNNGTAVKKKTMGRRKIEIKKIQKKPNLQVTFTKRRQGLFRKAGELSVLCGAEIAILVRSPADKIFAFGNPSTESLIGRFQSGCGGGETSSSAWQIVEQVECMRKYEEAVRKLEMEKRVKQEGGDRWWWEKSFEAMDLKELEQYAEALEKLGGQCLADNLGVLGSTH